MAAGTPIRLATIPIEETLEQEGDGRGGGLIDGVLVPDVAVERVPGLLGIGTAAQYSTELMRNVGGLSVGMGQPTPGNLIDLRQDCVRYGHPCSPAAGATIRGASGHPMDRGAYRVRLTPMRHTRLITLMPLTVAEILRDSRASV